MFKFSRILVAYLVAIPLALTLGYLVSSPDRITFMVLGTVLFLLALPLFLNWHHAMLIIFWNSVFNAFFLPTQPDFWLPIAALSFGISFLNHIIFQKKFLRAPEMTRPLIFLAAVVLVTAWCRGGIGIRAFGGNTFGGKYYIYVFGAIMGYFAFTAEPVPIAKGRKMAALFFLSGTTPALSNIIYLLGPAFYFLYYIVPSGDAATEAASDLGLVNVDRIAGFGSASIFALCFLLARFGIRGLFDWTKPWRFVLLLLTIVAAGLAGYRSSLVLLLLIFAFQFYLEGLLRTRFLPIVVGLAICGFIPILFFTSSMPSGIQRAVSFLPVNVDSEILEDAHASTEWRLGMWAEVVKEVPKYLLIGKGYAINPDDLRAAVAESRTGSAASNYEGSMIAGDYHSGPLSVIIPFGIFGVIAFTWVLIAGFRVLHSNYRYGDARLRQVNRVLLAYYLTECVSFIFIFGALSTQLTIFLGVCGLSVSLNGGVRKKVVSGRKPVSAPQTLALAQTRAG